MSDDPNQPLIDAFEGVPFTINGKELTGQCLTLKDGLRFARMYEKALAEETPTAEAQTIVEQLITEFPAAIGHPDLRMTLTEFWLTLRRFLYLRRGVPAPAELPTAQPAAKADPLATSSAPPGP